MPKKFIISTHAFIYFLSPSTLSSMNLMKHYLGNWFLPPRKEAVYPLQKTVIETIDFYVKTNSIKKLNKYFKMCASVDLLNVMTFYIITATVYSQGGQPCRLSPQVANWP
jgi:hypothetical protein